MAEAPPHSVEAEAALLGAMLLNQTALEIGLERCDWEDFYTPRYGECFRAMGELKATGWGIDAVSVGEKCTMPTPDLVALASDCPSPARAADYARIVRDTSLLRNVIRAAESIRDLAWDQGEVADVLDTAQKLLGEVARGRFAEGGRGISELLVETLDLVERRGGGKMSGVRTGFVRLDQLLLGLQPGSLTLVGARPSMGKTAFGLGLAIAASVRQQIPTLFASLEMSEGELTQRVLSMESGVDMQKIKRGVLDQNEWTKLHGVIESVGTAPLVVDDNAGQTVSDLRSKVRQRGSQLVVVDYLQLMSAPTKRKDDNRQQEVSDLSRSLKIMARELEVAVVALSQLNRSLEGRINKRPKLSDLRESGSLEQDADVVGFLYRDEMYHPDKPSVVGQAEFNIEKHRNGPCGIIPLTWTASCCRFSDR